MADISSNSGAMFSQETAADLLRQALAVLKQGDVSEAIAQLESLTRTTADRSIQLKAQMGLVKAYEQQGDVERAIALCQQIQFIPSKQAQQWATQTLTQLQIRWTASSASTEAAIAPPQKSSPTHSSTATPSVQKSQTLSVDAIPPTALTADALLRESDRAQRWSPLNLLDRSLLWVTCALTVLLLVVLLRGVLLLARNLFNGLLIRFTFPVDLRGFYIHRDPAALTILLVVVLAIALTWALPRILQRIYRMQPFSLEALASSSPEASRIVRQVFQKRGGAIPKFGLLPLSAPLIFSYGILPQKTAIVVSQGLLQQLTADELATLVAAEVGHILSFDYIPMSIIALAIQLPYLAYLRLADWGDTLSASRSPSRKKIWLLQAIAILSSTVCYGIYLWLRLAGLLLSRLRVYYSDRTATSLTGNPNALTRALLKLVLGIAQDMESQKQTRVFLQSFDLLLPIGPQLALTPGSLLSRNPDPRQFERSLSWDQHNPYRNLLAFNNAHPLMGDRLSRLTQYARHLRLTPQLSLPPTTSTSPFAIPITRSLLLQLAPLLGLFGGWAIAMFLWLVGAVALNLGWLELDWLWQDSSILQGLLLIGTGLGFLIRINTLFPDIKPSTLRNFSLSQLLTHPNGIPVEGQPVRLQGNLLGRRGVHNQFSQDLFLQNEEGCIALHFVPKWGPLEALLPHTSLPETLIQRTVTITGWVRRGATVWIDVETIRSQSGKVLLGGHPVWTTAIAFLLVLCGVYTITRGNF